MTRGRSFEQKVFGVLRKLEQAGFARDLEMPAALVDRAGLTRRIDIAFTLVTDLIDIRILVECKARERNLSIGDVDQLRTLRMSLPKQNIYWLVSSGRISKTAQTALRDVGISFYQFNDLQERVQKAVRVARKRTRALQELRKYCARFNVLWDGAAMIYPVQQTRICDHCLIDAMKHVLLPSEFDRVRPALERRIMAEQKQVEARAVEISSHNAKVEEQWQLLQRYGGNCPHCNANHRDFVLASTSSEKKCLMCNLCGRSFAH